MSVNFSILAIVARYVTNILSITLFHLHIAATAYSNARYGQGSGSILLDNVGCTGTENRLIDCYYSSHTADCSHSEDAAVYCSICKLNR